MVVLIDKVFCACLYGVKGSGVRKIGWRPLYKDTREDVDGAPRGLPVAIAYNTAVHRYYTCWARVAKMVAWLF